MAPHRPGRGLAVYAGGIAASACYGAAGLILGFLPGIDLIRPRLPFDSTLLGGVALAVVVCVPTAMTAVLAWRHDPRAARSSLVAGVLLVGWIVVEVLLIWQFSPLQPLCVVLGLGLVAWGLVPAPDPVPAGRRPSRV